MADPKIVKNRLHLCVRPVGTTCDAEAERIVALGATIVGDRRGLINGGWVVLADPEGNESCVLRTPAEAAGIL